MRCVRAVWLPAAGREKAGPSRRPRSANGFGMTIARLQCSHRASLVAEGDHGANAAGTQGGDVARGARDDGEAGGGED